MVAKLVYRAHWLMLIAVLSATWLATPANATDEFPPPITATDDASISIKFGRRIEFYFLCIGGVQYAIPMSVSYDTKPMTLLVRPDGLPRTCEGE